MREDLARYQSETPCEVCKGARLKPEALAVKIEGRDIAGLSALTIREARRFLELSLSGVHAEPPAAVPLGALNGVEGYRDVLFADAQEAADRHDKSVDPAFLAHQHIGDFADLRVGSVVHVLLIKVGNRGGRTRDR